MLRQLQMCTESAQTAVHSPTRGPTTQPTPPTCELMRSARRRHQTAAPFVAAAAPKAVEHSTEVTQQGLEAVEGAPIVLHLVVHPVTPARASSPHWKTLQPPSHARTEAT